MPDSSGRFKGISVPRIPWHEPKPEPVDERPWDNGTVNHAASREWNSGREEPTE